MRTTRFNIPLVVFCTILLGAAALASCGGDNTSSPGPAKTAPPGGTGDILTMSVNGGPTTVYAEKSGLPSIDCDPRVDWAFSQVVGWANFVGGAGPNGYELFIDIMFPLEDTVGTYTVQGDFVQVLVYNQQYYTASPAYPATSGTVEVTRADTRIEGTYDVVAADSAGTVFVTFAGTFDVARGVSLSCE